MNEQFDKTEVIRHFLTSKRTPEVQDLLKEFRIFLATTDQGRMLIAEVSGESLSKGTTPTQLAGIAIMHGMTLGVMMERARMKKVS
jgi:hypothetical protein